MPRRFLIAPDKFKGSLTAEEAAQAMADGVLRTEPDADIDLCPIADGGEGFAETVCSALGGLWVSCGSVDARGRPIDSRYLVVDSPSGPVAVIGMAETAGIWRLTPGERDPLAATTRGVGMQIRHAVANHTLAGITLGIGGSATNDGGCGMAAELGVRFLDADGSAVDPVPAKLPTMSHVDPAGRISLPPITVACDVDNPLLGENGATAVFSRQKGASESDLPVLENALARLVAISSGGIHATTPGAGAAGGLGFGLLHFADATLVPGFELLAGLLGLEDRIANADVVITGEGSLDAQSLGGKAPVALARMARQRSVPTLAIAGSADSSVFETGLFERVCSLADSGVPVEDLMRNAGNLVTDIVADAVRI